MVGLGVFTISSCTTDKCKGVVCQNGGTCVNGNCNCATGYEGSNCQTKANAKFVGVYTGTEVNNGSGTAVSYTITAAADPGAIIINEDGVFLNATVSGNAITIPAQTFTDAGFWYTYTGSGTLNGNSLTVTTNNHADDHAGNTSDNPLSFTGTK